MNWAARSVVASVLACGAAMAAAAGWSVDLPDGRQVAIVADGSAGDGSHMLERRNPDGSLDRGFGKAGRVVFSLGADSPPPRSIRADSSGRLLVVGGAQGLQDRVVPASVRFLSDGSIDLSWGARGRSLAPSPGTDAIGVDLLPLADGSVLMLGQIEGESAEQAALWLLSGNGVVDESFGQGGALRSTGLGMSEGLALQLDDDGAALVAVMTAQQGLVWLEVHRWQPGANPLRVARQPMPLDWQGPVTLARRGGAWQWFDASQPVTNGGVPLVAEAAVAVWSNAVMPGAVSGGVAQNAQSDGGAAWNPFSTAAGGDTPAPAIDSDEVEPPWAAVVALALAVMGAVAWWRRGRAETAVPTGPDAVSALITQLAHADEPRKKAAPNKPAARAGGSRGHMARWRERNGPAEALRAARDLARGTPVPAASPSAAPEPVGRLASAEVNAEANLQGIARQHHARLSRPREPGGAGGFRGRRSAQQLVHDVAMRRQPADKVLVFSRNPDGHVEVLGPIPTDLGALGWLKCLRQMADASAAGSRIHLICNRRGAPRHRAVRAWLARQSRFNVLRLPGGPRRR